MCLVRCTNHGVNYRRARLCLALSLSACVGTALVFLAVPASAGTPKALRRALTTIQEARAVLREATSDTPTRSEDAATRLEKLGRASKALREVVTVLPDSGFASQARKLLPQIEEASARMGRITENLHEFYSYGMKVSR